MNVKELVAIDIHTHAEEPCGTHPDDGYDDLQAAMAVYFIEQFEPVTAREAIHVILSLGLGAALIRFGVLERRAHRNG